MLRTDCALQLILQHIIHLIQHLFFLGSHLFLLLLVEKYMLLCINKEQGFSHLAGVCPGEENHTVNLHTSSRVDIYHIPRSVISFFFLVSTVLRIFPPTTENLEVRTAITQNSLQPKVTTSRSIFSESFSTCSYQEFGFNQYFFSVCLI